MTNRNENDLKILTSIKSKLETMDRSQLISIVLALTAFGAGVDAETMSKVLGAEELLAVQKDLAQLSIVAEEQENKSANGG